MRLLLNKWIPRKEFLSCNLFAIKEYFHESNTKKLSPRVRYSDEVE